MIPTGGDPEGRFWNKSHVLQSETSLFSCHSVSVYAQKTTNSTNKKKILHVFIDNAQCMLETGSKLLVYYTHIC